VKTMTYSESRAHYAETLDSVINDREEVVITRAGRDPVVIVGKPEPLKHGFHGYWSRRITDEHRLVYKVVDDEVRIAACRYHYAP
jgi:toxin YoeB